MVAFLPYQLSVLANRVNARFASHYRERYGISASEWRVMAQLSREEAVSVREICLRLDMEKPKVSRAASRLQDAGYLVKKVNEADRRLIELSLTEKGRAMISELTPLAKAYEAELESHLNGQEPEFRDMVSTLIGALSK